MKAILLVPAIAAAGLVLTACDDDPDTVIVESETPAEPEGDSVSFSVGDDGVSFSSEDNDADGSGSSVSVNEDGISVESRDND